MTDAWFDGICSIWFFWKWHHHLLRFWWMLVPVSKESRMTSSTWLKGGGKDIREKNQLPSHAIFSNQISLYRSTFSQLLVHLKITSSPSKMIFLPISTHMPTAAHLLKPPLKLPWSTYLIYCPRWVTHSSRLPGTFSLKECNSFYLALKITYIINIYTQFLRMLAPFFIHLSISDSTVLVFYDDTEKTHHLQMFNVTITTKSLQI